MLKRRKNGKGKRMPAIGIQVTPKHNSKYTNWKIVKLAMYLNGTDSTKDACTPSMTLSTWSLKSVKEGTGFANAHIYLKSLIYVLWATFHINSDILPKKTE